MSYTIEFSLEAAANSEHTLFRSMLSKGPGDRNKVLHAGQGTACPHPLGLGMTMLKSLCGFGRRLICIPYHDKITS